MKYAWIQYLAVLIPLYVFLHWAVRTIFTTRVGPRHTLSRTHALMLPQLVLAVERVDGLKRE